MSRTCLQRAASAGSIASRIRRHVPLILLALVTAVPATAGAIPSEDEAAATTPTPQATAPPVELTLEEQADQAAEKTKKSWAIIEGLLQQRVKTKNMEELQIIDAQLDLRVGTLKENLDELMSLIQELDDRGLPSEEPRKVAARILRSARKLLWSNLRRSLEAVERQTRVARRASSDDRLAEERKLTTLSGNLNGALKSLLTVSEYQQMLGIDVSKDLTRLDGLLQQRLEPVAGELKVVSDRLDALRSKIADADPEEAAALKDELPPLEEAHHRAVRDLTDLVELAGERNLDVDSYKKLLIQATGAASVGMLNRRVALGLVRDAIRNTRDRLVTLTPLIIFRTITFVVVMLVFWILARIVSGVVSRTVHRPGAQMPQLLRGTVVTSARNIILGIGFMVAISQMGIQVGPILAGLGIAGFIMGFALQDTLSNFAAGLMILIYRPFDVGDAVQTAGVFGKVVRVSVVSTTIDTFDNQRHIIPNRKVWGDVITNRTACDTRRVDLTFFTGYEADVERVEAILHEIIEDHPLTLDEPEPIIRLQRVTENGLEFVARPWTGTRDYWKVFREVTREVKLRFDAEGIPPPTPRREIFLRERGSSGDPPPES